MNKKAKLLLSCITLLLLVFAANKGYQYFKRSKAKDRHTTTPAPLEQKPFVILIPSYNNVAFYKRNLRSVFEQHYDNYRVIYIDDASKDGTYDQVKQFIEEEHLTDRVTLLHNTQNQGALANLYRAIHTCKDEEIIVTLDGDDFLAHEEVLLKLNRAYANPNVWMTYGNFVDYPSYTQKPVMCKKIPSYVIQNNSYRKQEWVSSHLRTFYAGLFKKIQLQHLLFEGKFFPMGSDLAFMFPLLEMSGKHALFIKDILYLYNRVNPINDHKVNVQLQNACGKTARRLSRYPRLRSLVSEAKQEMDATDLLILSEDRPEQLRSLLESLSTMQGVNHVSVLYRCAASLAASYEEVGQSFPEIRFVSYSDLPLRNFRLLFLNEIFNDARETPSPFITLLTDEWVIQEPIDFSECIHSMNQTGAYGFYLGQGVDTKGETPAFATAHPNIYFWQYKQGQEKWRYANSLEMVLYRKANLSKDLSHVTFSSLETLKNIWATRLKKRKIGLFYSTPKAVIQENKLYSIN